MGFFDLFKKKESIPLEAEMRKVLATVFPDGDVDIDRDIQRIGNLTNGKLPHAELRGFVTSCKVLTAINDSYDDEGFITSFLLRSKNRLTPSEARDVYVYLAGESMARAKLSLMVKKNSGALTEDMSKHLEELALTWAYGTTSDAIPGGRGEFGLTVDNPIPTVCVKGSNVYLSRLRYLGRQIESNRRGSAGSSVTKGKVDIYQISQNGTVVGTIYICPYHRKDSKRAPKGFTLSQV
jgi:hypothetical protein